MSEQLPDDEYKYLIDTDVLVHIQGHTDSQKIYAGIVTFAKSGKLKTVRQVLEELKRFPAPYAKIIPHRKLLQIPEAEQFVAPVGTWLEYVQDNADFLCAVVGGKNPDPADPWLIAVAKHYGFTIVTDEKANSPVKIPAVCKMPNINCRCISGPHFLHEVGIVQEIKPEHISTAAFYS